MRKILLEVSFSKIYMIAMILISLLILGGYFSYAMFTVSKEKSNAISIVTGNLTYELLVDGEKMNTLSVPANSSKEFIVTLTNPNNRVARFNFYYVGNLIEGTDVGYIERNSYNKVPTSTGINLEKSGTSGSSNTYLIRVNNITNNEVTIQLGVNVGLDYNNLEIPSDGHLFRKLITTGTVKDVLEDDIMNRLNYEDSEQTFITGSNPSNYIWYSGKLWRAMSIDTSDNSVKIITQWNMTTIPYSNGISTYSTSYMNEWLNDTSVDGFLGNLREPENFIKMNSVWNATQSTSTNKLPTTTIVTAAVGSLNNYEYRMSYNNATFSTGYLNNSLYFWTITPYSSSNINTIGPTTIEKFSSGTDFGIRPAINIKSNVKIVDGNGTKEDPYRLEGDNDTNLSGTLLNTRYSGEYISFGAGENNLYRIVSHETEGLTKITSAKPLVEKGAGKNIVFGSTSTFSSTNTIGSFLNNNYLNPNNGYLTSEQVNMIENSTTWYIGISYTGYSYRRAKYTTDTGNTLVASKAQTKIGLLRSAELLSSQQDSVDNTIAYWTLTPWLNNTIIKGIRVNGYKGEYTTTSTLGIRPTMNLKSTVKIVSGEGTQNNPFVLSSN